MASQLTTTTGPFARGELLTAAQQAELRGSLGAPKQSLIDLRNTILSRIPTSWELMADAPTIVLGTANAASTITGAVNISKNSVLTSESSRCVDGTGTPNNQFRIPLNLDGQAPGVAAAYTASLNCSWGIITDAPELEYRTKGDGQPCRGRLWVTENGVRRFAGLLPEIPLNGSLYWVKITFAARATRTIEVEMSGGKHGGWNVGPDDLCGQHILRGPHVMVTGDSFTEGGSSGRLSDGYAPRLLRILGLDRRSISALGGTGYSANGSGGTRKNLLQRYQNDVIGLVPDVIMHTNGINDTLESIAANAPVIFDGIAQALPNSTQIVFGPFNPRSIASEDKRALLQSLCAERGLLFIDNITEKEITGTGWIGNKLRNGNSDIVIGVLPSDSTHPTPYGHQYLAEWRAAAIIHHISALL